MKSEEISISNFTVDGKVGGGIAFTMCSDHENRPTDTTNLIIYEIEEDTDREEIL